MCPSDQVDIMRDTVAFNEQTVNRGLDLARLDRAVDKDSVVVKTQADDLNGVFQPQSIVD